MPKPNPGEKRDDYISRCIPIVIHEGTAKDPKQAAAICHSMWEKHLEGKGNWVTVDEMRTLCPSCAEKMVAKGFTKVNLDEIELEFGLNIKAGDIEKLTQHLVNTYGNDPGFWTKCDQSDELSDYDEETRAAICARAHKIATGKWPTEKSIKVGARHSASDQSKLQEIHDATNALGANCPEPQGEITEYSFALMSADNALVSFGTSVKALGNGKVGGYLVRFGDENTPDLTGDFFTKDTDFGDISQADVYYAHGMDAKMGKRKLGKGKLVLDEIGMWIESQMLLRDEYEKAVYELAEKGKLGWSSGTAAHLVEREMVGKANLIKSWPLGLDASMTPTPAEPRNNVMPLKSYIKTIAEPEPGVPEINQTNPNKEKTMDENVTLSKEQLDQLLAKAGSSGAEAALKSLPPINKGEVVVTKDEADKPFQNLGDQLFAVKQATLTQGRELAPRLRGLNVKALGANELIGSEGGFLLEPSFAAGLLTPVHETGPFSSRCSKLTIGPNANGVTVRAVDETSRADCYRWGGILGYRLAEAGTKLPTFPTFRLVELRLKKYAVLCYATEELLQDTTALAGIVQQGCSEELDFMVNDDILNGLGAAGPLGIMASGALVSVGKEAGQLADTIVTQNIFKMWARMHPRSKGNAVWFINTDVTPQLYQLSLSVGTGGMPMYMAPGSLPNAPSGALLGRPVVETEFNATIGDQGDIVLADMSQYAMIDRDVQAASSIHVQFLTDQVAYRFVYRCDGQPKIAKPLTPYKGSGTLSPFVTLDARG